MKKNLLTAFTLLVSLLSTSQTFIVDNVEYEVTSTSPNTVTIIDNTNSGDLVIPETVENGGITYAITSIGSFAFSSNSLRSINIPDGVTSIGEWAFRFNFLTSLTIPSSVTSIGDNAFRENQLTSLTIPNSITTIGEAVFFSNRLTNVTIPNSVTSIGNFAFQDNELVSVIIPNNVTSIGVSAFNENPLTEVITTGTTPAITQGSASGLLETNVFTNNRSNIDLIIPDGTTATYLAAGWTGFKSIRENSSLSIVGSKLSASTKLIIKQNALDILYPSSIKLKSYNIYNISGVKVLSGTNKTIGINNLSSGLYVIELNFNKIKIRKKFVKS